MSHFLYHKRLRRKKYVRLFRRRRLYNDSLGRGQVSRFSVYRTWPQRLANFFVRHGHKRPVELQGEQLLGELAAELGRKPLFWVCPLRESNLKTDFLLQSLRRHFWMQRRERIRQLEQLYGIFGRQRRQRRQQQRRRQGDSPAGASAGRPAMTAETAAPASFALAPAQLAVASPLDETFGQLRRPSLRAILRWAANRRLWLSGRRPRRSQLWLTQRRQRRLRRRRSRRSRRDRRRRSRRATLRSLLGRIARLTLDRWATLAPTQRKELRAAFGRLHGEYSDLLRQRRTRRLLGRGGNLRRGLRVLRARRALRQLLRNLRRRLGRCLWHLARSQGQLRRILLGSQPSLGRLRRRSRQLAALLLGARRRRAPRWAWRARTLLVRGKAFGALRAFRASLKAQLSRELATRGFGRPGGTGVIPATGRSRPARAKGPSAGRSGPARGKARGHHRTAPAARGRGRIARADRPSPSIRGRNSARFPAAPVALTAAAEAAAEAAGETSEEATLAAQAQLGRGRLAAAEKHRARQLLAEEDEVVIRVTRRQRISLALPASSKGALHFYGMRRRRQPALFGWRRAGQNSRRPLTLGNRWQPGSGPGFAGRGATHFLGRTLGLRSTGQRRHSLRRSLWSYKYQPLVSYKLHQIRVIDPEEGESRWLLAERSYCQVSRRRILEDFFAVITPGQRVISIQAGRNKYVRYLRHVTKGNAARWERENVLFRWLREDVLKNEAYNFLIRNTRRKPNPKPRPRLRPRRSNRLQEPFAFRLALEFDRLFSLSEGTLERLNEYNDLARLRRATSHYRWQDRYRQTFGDESFLRDL